MASRSSRAAAALAASLALAGCPTREPEVRPFHIRAVAPGGAPLETLAPVATYYVLFGTGDVVAPTELRLAGATYSDGRPFGDLTLAYDGAPAPGAVFGAELQGVPVRLLVLADPGATGPAGEPLPIPGFRVATGVSPDFRHRLVVWEATYTAGDGVADVFAPAGPHPDDPSYPDIPDFVVDDVYAAWEPAECGLLYYDVMSALGESEAADVVLERGERGSVPIGTSEPPWNVLHVQSWHRDGRCAGQAQAWSQLAAWRPAAAP